MSLDFAPAIYAALIADSTITGLLSEYKTNPAIFTRRPIPADAVYPYIVVNPDASVTDFDALNSDRPIIIRDIAIYGQQPDDYRAVEQIGYLVRELFHRNRFSLSNSDYNIVLITATGPQIAPVDDDHTVGRLVSLRIQLENIS